MDKDMAEIITLILIGIVWGLSALASKIINTLASKIIKKGGKAS